MDARERAPAELPKQGPLPAGDIAWGRLISGAQCVFRHPRQKHRESKKGKHAVERGRGNVKLAKLMRGVLMRFLGGVTGKR